MKTCRIEGKIIRCYRLNNSVNDNPRWYFMILVNGGSVYEFKTQSDSAVGYLFKPWYYYNVVVDYHITRTGKNICESISYGHYVGLSKKRKV